MSTHRRGPLAARVKYINSPWALAARFINPLGLKWIPVRQKGRRRYLVNHAEPPIELIKKFGYYGLRRMLDLNPELVWRLMDALEERSRKERRR